MHLPSFLQAFASLTGLYFVSYFLGYLIIRILRINPEAKVHREFVRLTCGFFVLLFAFAIFKTKGATIFLGLILPATFFLFKRTKNLNSDSPFFPGWKLIFIHLFFIGFCFCAAYFTYYNPISGNLREADIDYLVYGRTCEHMGITGEENNFLDWYVPEKQGASFYHYGDLWAGVLVESFSGLGYYFGLFLVANPFLVLISFWAAFSFLESKGFKMSWMNALLCSGLIIFSPFDELVQRFVFAPVYWSGIGPFMAFVNQIDTGVFPLYSNPKIALVLIAFFWCLRQIQLQDFRNLFLIIGSIFFLFSAIVPPLVIAILCFSIYLIFVKKEPFKKLVQWLAAPIIFLFFIGMFYSISRGTSADMRMVSSSDYFQFLLNGDEIQNAVFLCCFSLIGAVAGLTPFLPFLFRPFLRFIKKPFSLLGESSIFLGLALLFSGIVCLFFFQLIYDNHQFWIIPLSVVSSGGILFGMVKIFNVEKRWGLKFYAIFLILLLAVQNFPRNSEIGSEKRKFFEDVIEICNGEPFKFGFFTKIGHENFFGKIIFLSHPLVEIAPFVNQFRPVCLTTREVKATEKPMYQNLFENIIRTSEFNRFVEAQIQANQFLSESESKITFMKLNQIKFAILTREYEPDSLLKLHLTPKFTSPMGWQFCEFN